MERQAIVWRWPNNAVLSQTIDATYTVTQNHWRGETRFQLEIQALRPHHEAMELQRSRGCYRVQRIDSKSLKLINPDGESLVSRVNREGELESDDSRASHPYVAALLQEACIGLGLRP